MRHKAIDWASEAFLVMQLFVAPGLGCYEATLALRAINYTVSQMNSRLQQSNTRRSHAWKALWHRRTRTRGEDRRNTDREANRWRLRTTGTGASKCCRLLHSQEGEGIRSVLPVNSFTANYTGVQCVLLQFTSAVSDFPEGLSPDSPANRAVQCSSGLYKPECATVRELLECKLSSVPASVHVHHRTAYCPLLRIWDFMWLFLSVSWSFSQSAFIYSFMIYSEPVPENSLNTVCCALWKLV